jgi:hypothetical protein
VSFPSRAARPARCWHSVPHCSWVVPRWSGTHAAS